MEAAGVKGQVEGRENLKDIQGDMQPHQQAADQSASYHPTKGG
jgi:hypothetical protein